MLIKDVWVGDKNVLTDARGQSQYNRQEQAAKKLSTPEPERGGQRVPEKIYSRDYRKCKPEPVQVNVLTIGHYYSYEYMVHIIDLYPAIA